MAAAANIQRDAVKRAAEKGGQIERNIDRLHAACLQRSYESLLLIVHEYTLLIEQENIHRDE